jgi:hypothetical protein
MAPPRKRARPSDPATSRAGPGRAHPPRPAAPVVPVVARRLVPGALPLRAALLSLASAAARREAGAADRGGEARPLRGPGSARSALAAALDAPGGGAAYEALLGTALCALRGPPPAGAAFRLSQQSSQEEVRVWVGGRARVPDISR